MKAFLHRTSAFVLVVAAALAVGFPVSAAELNSTPTFDDVTPERNVPDPNASTTAPKFDAAIEDLPMMPGLSPAPDEETLFVVPKSGRIADSVAIGAVDIDDVYKFYRRSLPQLGWKMDDMRTYERDNERLRIDAHADGKVTTVRFSVFPR